PGEANGSTPAPWVTSIRRRDSASGRKRSSCWPAWASRSNRPRRRPEAVAVAHSAAADLEYSPSVSRTYAWIIFALIFGLLLSDYMSRQVLNAVFPLLKAEWRLSDTQLGSLAGVVSLMVGLLTVPLSLVA